MSDQRRPVRVTPSLFADLDRQLPSQRHDDGTPSRGDFVVYDLWRIVEEFSTNFDNLFQPIPGRPGYRLNIGVGMVVPRYAATGELRPDGSIELLELELDLGATWDDESSDDS